MDLRITTLPFTTSILLAVTGVFLSAQNSRPSRIKVLGFRYKHLRVDTVSTVLLELTCLGLRHV